MQAVSTGRQESLHATSGGVQRGLCGAQGCTSVRRPNSHVVMLRTSVHRRQCGELKTGLRPGRDRLRLAAIASAGLRAVSSRHRRWDRP